MKKTLLSVVAITGLLLSANAQQIENGSFEDGTYQSSTGNADPVGYGTLNFDQFGLPQTTTLSGTDPFEGDTSAVLTTRAGHAAVLGVGNDTIPGTLYANDVFTGFENDAHSERLQSVMFSYKCDNINQDSSFAYVELSDDADNIIGNAFQVFGGTVTDWTSVNLEIGYANANPVDSLFFQFSSSGGGSADAEPGSVLEVDAIVLCKEFAIDFDAAITGGDVDFTSMTSATGNGGMGTLLWDFGDGNTSTDMNPSHTYTANDTYTVSLTVVDSCGNDSTYTDDVVVSELSLSQEELLNTKLYPNPTSNILNISAAEDLSRVIVYNLVGRKVMDTDVSGTETKVDVSSIPTGTYLVEMITEKGTMSRKQFVKK